MSVTALGQNARAAHVARATAGATHSPRKIPAATQQQQGGAPQQPRGQQSDELNLGDWGVTANHDIVSQQKQAIEESKQQAPPGNNQFQTQPQGNGFNNFQQQPSNGFNNAQQQFQQQPQGGNGFNQQQGFGHQQQNDFSFRGKMGGNGKGFKGQQQNNTVYGNRPDNNKGGAWGGNNMMAKGGDSLGAQPQGYGKGFNKGY